MGVHTTFVRSVDLDEWTQRQIDAMRLGGNANARQVFRQHGVTDMHGKIEKKYKSKAAIAYRAELAKLVEAEAAKRGEGTIEENTNSATLAESLLEDLSLQDKKEDVKPTLQTVTLQPKAQLASQREGAKGKLVITPPNSGGLSSSATTLLRKPAAKPSSMMLKKKPSGGASSKLRVNKLSMDDSTNTATTGASSNDAFDDNTEDPKSQQQAETEASMNTNTSNEPQTNGSTVQPVVAAPATPVESPKKPASIMEEGMSRLKAMNNDFFSGV